MNIEQIRADFEAWAARYGHDLDAVMLLSKPPKFSHYVDQATQAAFEAYQAGRAALQSQEGAVRYTIVEYSQSGHCCFGYTVVDTNRPFLIHGEHYRGQFIAVCECFDEADAQLICDALNAHEARRVEGTDHE